MPAVVLSTRDGSQLPEGEVQKLDCVLEDSADQAT